ncbi:MAG: MBL fold metallo-hydrolase [Puniceicoccales bacterium]|jgi:L-ascorbate metabolism protein UlaG (beta-lactamase superfamily)|nr:MBL fold metallo-hydrolase [Puniceicoccales bacterium]
MKEYHFDGTKFYSPDAPPMATWKRVVRWWFSRRQRGHWPKYWDAPDVFAIRRRAAAKAGNPALGGTPAQQNPPAGAAATAAGTTAAAAAAVAAISVATPSNITWVNHSTFLIETPEGNFLTDPVYSRHAGPLGLLGPRRHHAPGVPFDALPPIHFVLLSHDHYDHCDLGTLRKLAHRDSPAAITLLGNGGLLRKAGFSNITELDWWGGTTAPGTSITVTATPAQHWSNRVVGPRCGRLWGGFWLELGDGKKIYFAGDTGYNPRIFQEIRRRLGSPDMALLPIGAYAPRWFMSPQHCDPAQAVQIHKDLGAHRSVAMHWGCFRLTDEAHDAPPKELAAVLKKKRIPPDVFRVLIPGQGVTVEKAAPAKPSPAKANPAKPRQP